MVTAMFGSSLCWVRWEVHPKRWNRWKNICKFLLNQLFPPMLEWSDLRNVPFLWAALTWILFVYSLVFVHTLKVGFWFYSDKISSLLASSNDENLHTSSLELPQFFQVWGLFWFWVFFFTSAKLCSNQLFIFHLCWLFVELKYCTFVLILSCLFWTVPPVCQKWVKNLGIVLQLVFVSPQLGINLFFFRSWRLLRLFLLHYLTGFFLFALRVFYFICSIYISPNRRLHSFSWALIPWHVFKAFLSFQYLKEINFISYVTEDTSLHWSWNSFVLSLFSIWEHAGHF